MPKPAASKQNAFNFLFKQISKLNGNDDKISDSFASSSNRPDSLLASGDQISDSSKAFFQTGTSPDNKSKASAISPSSSLQQQLQINRNKTESTGPEGTFSQPYRSQYGEYLGDEYVYINASVDGNYEFEFNLSGEAYLKFLRKLLRNNPGFPLEVQDPSGTLEVDVNSVYTVQIGVSVEGFSEWTPLFEVPAGSSIKDFLVLRSNGLNDQPIEADDGVLFRDPTLPDTLPVKTSPFDSFVNSTNVNFALQIKDSVTGIPSMGAFFYYRTKDTMNMGDGFPSLGYAGLPLDFEENSLAQSWLNKPRSLEALRNLVSKAATTYRYRINEQVTTSFNGPADGIPNQNVWTLTQTPQVFYTDQAFIDNLQAGVVDAVWANNMTTSDKQHLRWPALDEFDNVFDPLPDSNLFSPSFLGV